MRVPAHMKDELGPHDEGDTHEGQGMLGTQGIQGGRGVQGIQGGRGTQTGRTAVRTAVKALHSQHTALRSLRSNADLALQSHDRLQRERRALESEIQSEANVIEAMDQGQKKLHLIQQYNEKLALHQKLSEQERAAHAAYEAAEQQRFTAEIELSKKASLETQLLEDERESFLELQVRSQQRKEAELVKMRRAEQEYATRQREFLEIERAKEENSLRAKEESRKARSLALERLRNRVERTKALNEEEEKERENEAQRRIKALLSLKQNADDALSELKAANERRAQKQKAQNEARLQETVNLLAQGRNPYEHFRRRDMELKKQQELNRITIMAAKRREDVRQLMAEDIRQYDITKRKEQGQGQIRDVATPEADKSLGASNITKNTSTSENFALDVLENTRANTSRKEVEIAAEEEAERNEHPKKKFTLNLPTVASGRRSYGELNELQSALSLASLASSVMPSTRSSMVDGDGYTMESYRSVAISRRDGDGTHMTDRDYTSDSKSTRKTRVPKPLSILEQKMLERTMQSLKNNIVKKQVVMNKEFEGKSFITKPNVLLFDDFEVGSSYTKKVSVTNVSLSFNTFKVLELPARVSDFFKISYAPPGRLSAGTGVNIEVTFTPVLPTQLSEKLVILAETGQFEIPIECTPKQCKVSMSANQVEFDNISLGETQVKTVKIINNGGLETSLELWFDLESFSLDSNSSTFVDSDGNSHNVVTTVQSSFLFDATPRILGAYSTITFDITFSPKFLGTYSATVVFRHKGTDNNLTETRLTLMGTMLDVPIYLSSREVDFHVCFCGQMYREVIVLHNRGKTALKATVKVPSLLKKYVEFVPRVAFVQAHSSLSVQLKFKPTIDLLSPSMAELMCSSSPTPTLDMMTIDDSSLPTSSDVRAEGMALDEINSLIATSGQQACCSISMAVTVEVASQCSPVWFQLKALVTHPILSVSPPSFDFGECSINESVSIPFTVRNHSIVPVKYGFVRLPKEIQVYPGEGFGSLLPLEEMSMLATFSPATATHHSFALTAKTDQGKIVTIPCTGTGIKPALQFTPAIITLPPTSLGDTNSTSVFLENISKIPQMFEIGVPVDCPFLQVTPVVQTIQPGARVHIKIDFEPGIGLDENSPNEIPKIEELQETKQHDASSKVLKHRTYSKKSNSRGTSTNPEPLTPSSENSHRSSKGSTEKKTRKKKQGSIADLTEVDTAPASPSAETGFKSHLLIAQSKPSIILPEGKLLTWKIPCFSKPAKALNSLKETQQLTTGETFSLVYLEISATVAPPTLVRVLEPIERPANTSRPLFANPPIDFGQVPVGQSAVKKLTIKNNSPDEIKPQLAAVYGTMTVLNAIRAMLPNQSQVLQIQYKPDTHGMHVESLEFTVGRHHRLVVPVQGQGVEPKLSLDPNDEVIDLGFTIAKDSAKREIKLVNASQFTVGYQIHLLRPGPKNLNGVNPFSVVPAEGDVPTGGEKLVTIMFDPDHENANFHDILQVEVKSENSKRTIVLKGSCTGTRGAYLLDPPIPESTTLQVYSNSITSMLKEVHSIRMNDVFKPGYSGCLPRGQLIVHFTQDSGPSTLSSIIRTLTFGNAKIKREKGVVVDVVLESLSPQATKDGFSVDTTRLSIEPDTTKTFTFKFDPSATLPPAVSKKIFADTNTHWADSASLLETSIKCTVKGGYAPVDKEGSTFVILLIGHLKHSI